MSNLKKKVIRSTKELSVKMTVKKDTGELLGKSKDIIVVKLRPARNHMVLRDLSTSISKSNILNCI